MTATSPSPFFRILALLICAAVLLFSPGSGTGSIREKEAQHNETYDYLAIGNSITSHPVCDYWWNQCGMAASTAENDYFHRVCEYLQEEFGSVNAQAFNLVEWETADGDRSGAFSLLDPWLTEELDLITVQLSENANRIQGLSKGLKLLIRHIQAACPKAQIILVDDFWNKEKAKVKKKAAKEAGIGFADLSAIRGNPEYQWQIGDIVLDAEGNPHAISRDDVARHPNDAGMAYIAHAIIGEIVGLP